MDTDTSTPTIDHEKMVREIITNRLEQNPAAFWMFINLRPKTDESRQQATDEIIELIKKANPAYIEGISDSYAKNLETDTLLINRNYELATMSDQVKEQTRRSEASLNAFWQIEDALRESGAQSDSYIFMPQQTDNAAAEPAEAAQTDAPPAAAPPPPADASEPSATAQAYQPSDEMTAAFKRYLGSPEVLEALRGQPHTLTDEQLDAFVANVIQKLHAKYSQATHMQQSFEEFALTDETTPEVSEKIYNATLGGLQNPYSQIIIDEAQGLPAAAPIAPETVDSTGPTVESEITRSAANPNGITVPDFSGLFGTATPEEIAAIDPKNKFENAIEITDDALRVLTAQHPKYFNQPSFRSAVYDLAKKEWDEADGANPEEKVERDFNKWVLTKKTDPAGLKQLQKIFKQESLLTTSTPGLDDTGFTSFQPAGKGITILTDAHNSHYIMQGNKVSVRLAEGEKCTLRHSRNVLLPLFAETELNADGTPAEIGILIGTEGKGSSAEKNNITQGTILTALEIAERTGNMNNLTLYTKGAFGRKIKLDQIENINPELLATFPNAKYLIDAYNNRTTTTLTAERVTGLDEPEPSPTDTTPHVNINTPPQRQARPAGPAPRPQ